MWDKFCGVGIMIRGKVSEYADYILAGSDESGLLKGILIGDKNDFSENLYSDMSKSGFMHIAAVSGLHVSFCALFLGVLLSAFSKKIRIAVTVPVLILFASVAAFTPSVNRAVIMMSIFLFSYLLMKDPDPVTSLFTAALVLVAANPYVVFNLSFILSFSATLSLLIFARPLTAISKAGAEKASEKISELTVFKRFVKNTKVLKNNIVKSISWLLDAFLVPFACQIGVMPILAYYFERGFNRLNCWKYNSDTVNHDSICGWVYKFSDILRIPASQRVPVPYYNKTVFNINKRNCGSGYQVLVMCRV